MGIRILIILFIISNTFFGAFYFSDTSKKYNTNENENQNKIIETNEQLQSEYNIDTNSVNSVFMMEGNNIIKQNGVTSSPIMINNDNRTHPFRYTEVTFLLTAFFSYTYATYLVFGLDAIETANVAASTTGRNRYKSLWISATLFEITAAVFCGAAVAYDSYQRVYGKKKEGFSFNFMPYYEPVYKDAGFLFSLSHPL
ncbi:hypothetical protein [uncultured Brachyspira sp.]|uniref:hypothetical protein n=1 Tax=uncultured Brachyspira sp. TaxID=221953 RepID=UPI00262967BA|nr:hypothetical protein [uncultured Brachyspira sp.]